MDAAEIAQQAANGLTLGLLYALIALGYTLVYGVLQLINFAHGEIMMFGAFYAYAFMEPMSVETASGLAALSALAAGVTAWDRFGSRRGRIAGACATVLAGGLFGGAAYALSRAQLGLVAAVLAALPYSALLAAALERIAYRPLRAENRLIPLISAIGASLFLQNLAQVDPWFFGTIRKSYTQIPPSLHNEAFSALGVRISNLQMLIAFVAVVMLTGLHLFITHSRLGTAIRATAQNRRVAALMGIDTDGVIVLTFALGAVLAAVAGVLYGIYLGSIYPFMGYMAGIKAFTAAVLGGIGSVPGAMVGGLVLGVLESVGAAFIDEGYKDAIAFAILIAVLLFRPSGIMGSSTREKV
ncbi:MAG: branched-chain amino acid ABC transporter permease [Candidatus Hydrogenedentota bacterium]